MATGEPRRRRVYIDTSAYIALLLTQKGHERVAAETADATRLSSILLLLESRRNLVSLAREGRSAGKNMPSLWTASTGTSTGSSCATSLPICARPYQ